MHETLKKFAELCLERKNKLTSQKKVKIYSAEERNGSFQLKFFQT